MSDDNLATKADIAALRADLQRNLKEFEQRITIRLGGLVLGATAAVLAEMLQRHRAEYRSQSPSPHGPRGQ